MDLDRRCRTFPSKTGDGAPGDRQAVRLHHRAAELSLSDPLPAPVALGDAAAVLVEVRENNVPELIAFAVQLKAVCVESVLHPHTCAKFKESIVFVVFAAVI